MRRIAFRVLIAVALVVAALPAAQAQSEKLTMTVAAPVRIAQQTLAPGEYYVEPWAALRVLVIQNKETAHRIFINSTCVDDEREGLRQKPHIDWVQDGEGQIAITGLYFPKESRTYRFASAGARKEDAAGIRAALHR